MFTSGLVPIRPANVDPAMPINGTGKEEWKGFVSVQEPPPGRSTRPAARSSTGTTAPQAGYEAPDDNWSLGALQRVDLLISNLGKGKNITPAKVVSAMNAAATQDVREMTFEPVLSKLLHGGKAPNARDAKMLSLLDAVAQEGRQPPRPHRQVGLGNITSPGAAIMDTSWPLLANAWASSVLGPKLSGELASFDSQFDQPPGGQYTGWHIYMDKDLRTMLKHEGPREVQRPLLRRRQPQALPLAAVEGDRRGRQAARQVSRAPNPSALARVGATRSGSASCPGLLPFTMRYTNRPTGIQQVLSFSGHSKQDTGR